MSGLTGQLGEPEVGRLEAEAVEMKYWRVGESTGCATVCIITRVGEDEPTAAGVDVDYLDLLGQLRDQAVAKVEAAA